MNLIDIVNRMRKREFRNHISSSRAQLYRTAYAWSHDPDVADDLVQQTLCNALQNYGQIRNIAALNGWLFKIMARCFADYRRRHKEVLTDDDIYGIDNFTPENAASEEQIVNRVREAVKRIPLEQRQVITLVDLERFSYIEVASILSIPVGTVMSRLSRGRSQLHKRLISVEKSENKDASTIQPLRRIK